LDQIEFESNNFLQQLVSQHLSLELRSKFDWWQFRIEPYQCL